MSHQNSNNWAELPSGMSVWGEVGASLAIANHAARLAEHDHTLQRRIRRNLLLEQIEKDHEKAVRFDRQAERHQKRAAAKIKAADRKLQSARTIQIDNGEEAVSQVKGDASRKNKARERHQTQNRKKKARLESEAKLLKKEAAVITEDADKLTAKASNAPAHWVEHSRPYLHHQASAEYHTVEYTPWQSIRPRLSRVMPFLLHSKTL